MLLRNILSFPWSSVYTVLNVLTCNVNRYGMISQYTVFDSKMFLVWNNSLHYPFYWVHLHLRFFFLLLILSWIIFSFFPLEFSWKPHHPLPGDLKDVIHFSFIGERKMLVFYSCVLQFISICIDSFKNINSSF